MHVNGRVKFFNLSSSCHLKWLTIILRLIIGVKWVNQKLWKHNNNCNLKSFFKGFLYIDSLYFCYCFWQYQFMFIFYSFIYVCVCVKNMFSAFFKFMLLLLVSKTRPLSTHFLYVVSERIRSGLSLSFCLFIQCFMSQPIFKL